MVIKSISTGRFFVGAVAVIFVIGGITGLEELCWRGDVSLVVLSWWGGATR